MSSFADISTVFWVVKGCAVIVLFSFGLRLGLLRKYRLVFAYLVVAALSDWGLLLISPWRLQAPHLYSYAYAVLSLGTICLALAVLLRICMLFGPLGRVQRLVLVITPLIVILVGFADTRRVWFFYRILDLAHVIAGFLGLFVVLRMTRSRRVLLGWNLKLVLLALTLPAVLYSLVFMIYTFRLSWGLNLSDQAANLWLNGISVAAWVILAVGMTEYSPPVFLDAKQKTGHNLDESDDDQTTRRMEVTKACST